MRKLFSVSFLLILLLSMQSVSVRSAHFPIIEFPLELSHQYTTSLNVIIDPNLPLTPLVTELDDLDGTIFQSNAQHNIYSRNQLDIDYQVLSESDRSNLVTFLSSIENSDQLNGHDFNSTAYENGEDYVFTNVTGRSYDADEALNWMVENIWDQSPNTFSLFLFNLTDLDDGIDHWFKIAPIDQDSNTSQVSFFSGTTGLTNGKSVSTWGGYQGQPIHFLDFSTKLWFGDFINTVWGEYNYRDSLLSQRIQDFNDTQTEELNTWLADYLYAFIITTYDFYQFNQAPVGRTVKVQNLMLFDWYDYNLTIDEADWLISTGHINETFSTAFDWMKFNITEQWVNISSYTNLINVMDQYISPKTDGDGYYLEIATGFLNYLDTVFIPENFDMDGADIILPSLVFLLNNTTFTYGGQAIAGIGGIGFQLQGLTPLRYYNNETPNRGFSDVILHEVGHSLGLPHPFSPGNLWPGDMTASVMGYYTSAPDFSQYDVNTIGNYHTSTYLAQALHIQSQRNTTHELDPYIDTWIELAQEEQVAWNFKEAVEYSLLAVCGYNQIYKTEIENCGSIDVEEGTRTTTIATPVSSTPFSASLTATGTNSASDNGLSFTSPSILISTLIILVYPINRFVKRK